MDNLTKEIFEGPAVRELLGLPSDRDVEVTPEDFRKYKIFVQSNSSNRGLKAGTQILFKKG
jgi:hypothetical protein